MLDFFKYFSLNIIRYTYDTIFNPEVKYDSYSGFPYYEVLCPFCDVLGCCAVHKHLVRINETNMYVYMPDLIEFYEAVGEMTPPQQRVVEWMDLQSIDWAAITT